MQLSDSNLHGTVCYTQLNTLATTHVQCAKCIIMTRQSEFLLPCSVFAMLHCYNSGCMYARSFYFVK